MKNTMIIIPARLEAKRFPNKPLTKIKGIPMVMHVFNRAKESKVGDVFVATPDDEIFEIVENSGGKAILTKKNHYSGTDRIYEAYIANNKNKNVDIIINLQGDMPSIKPNSISKLEKLMRHNKSDIGTLASPIRNSEEILDKNIVKVQLDEDLKEDNFVVAKDFFRIKKDLKNDKVYHHIGIYAFTNVALSKYVKLPRSKLEMERNLEQMRAMENDMNVSVGLSDSAPLGVDTQDDLDKIIREMS